jgi:GGDEF domain-containing protein
MIESDPKNFESEEKIDESIIENRLILLKEAKEKEEEKEKEKEKQEETDIEKSVLEIIGQLPKDLRSSVQEKYERLQSYKLSDKIVIREIKDAVIEKIEAYKDTRFIESDNHRFDEITNGKYLRHELSTIIDTVISEISAGDFTDGKIDLTKIKGLGLLFIDLDGLKAVNDIAGHNEGTEYLKRVLDVLQNGTTTNALRARGINVHVGPDGGDEFLVLFDDDVNLTELEGGQIYIDKIREAYTKEIHSINVTDLLNPNDPGIKKRLGKEIPPNFEFTANASAGAATLIGVLEKIKEDGSNYSAKKTEMISMLFKESGERELQNKNAFKKSLKESKDVNERYLSKVLKRTADVIILERKNEIKDEIIEEMKKGVKFEEDDKIKKLQEELVELEAA